MIIIAPLNAAQVYVPPFNGVEHPLAPAVMNALLRYGSGPVSLWKIVNLLANAQNPDSRAHRRSWRIRYLCACRELLRFGVLHRHGALIATSNFATRPRPRAPRRLSPSVVRSASETGGSNVNAGRVETATKNDQPPENKVVVANRSTVNAPQKSQSAPAPELVSAAASALARLPRRQKRIWSGWLNDDVRSYRNMRVTISGGEQVYVSGALRWRVVYTREPDGIIGRPSDLWKGWGVARADGVEVVRNEAARLLGSRKAGKVERKSEAKIRAARLNGTRPCAPGRKRGRPRATKPTVTRAATRPR